jgi:LmbE family N-acetylglucosaminyl deacetylase
MFFPLLADLFFYKNKFSSSNSLLMAAEGDICILVPHPDDEIIGCFHLLQQIGRLASVDLVYVTEDTSAVIASCRREESAAATATLRVRDRIWWSYPDGHLVRYQESLRQRLIDVAQRYKLILCVAPNDRTPDHSVLAAEAYSIIPNEKLLWYRSTWLTFPLYAADIIVSGQAKEKLSKLRLFRSQKNLNLVNVVRISAIEARRCCLSNSSVEAFRFAISGEVHVPPVNVLSIISWWLLLKLWR